VVENGDSGLVVGNDLAVDPHRHPADASASG
jgi:hypothetical protein